jgi:hypothetical protein
MAWRGEQVLRCIGQQRERTNARLRAPRTNFNKRVQVFIQARGAGRSNCEVTRPLIGRELPPLWKSTGLHYWSPLAPRQTEENRIECIA